ncbi:MAG: hypothetical protein KJ970_15535 [Candidatus Eisenbacteria bacterium]|uniref:DUF3570 domain-containing protein n=1 Tax=Eiseniibacteriota bacterium TaxID=2212470 RepID=A0A948W787_UNCEI|nr:hypothetical protein [Candidatus Eisenbacteria bacterium]MBU2692334.1 hypothetical protein [Candidatus Eisenbacteria bacterium]
MIHRCRLGVLASLVLILAAGHVYGEGSASQRDIIPLSRRILTDLIPSSAQDPTPPKKKSSSKKTSGTKKAKPKRKANPIKVSGNFFLKFLYTGNAYNYSEEYISEFRHSMNPHKFAMNTVDDLVVEPRIDVDFEKKFIKYGPTTLGVSYIRSQYTSNHNKSKDSFRIDIRQPVWGSDWMSFGYSLTPYSYIRKMSDRPPYVPRSTPIDYFAFQYTNNTFAFEYAHRFSYPYRLNIRAGRVIRYYNQPQMENDNWEWYIGGKFYWYASKSWRFSAEYRYSDAPARAADSIGETLETSDDSDPSFERDAYYIDFRYAPRGKLWIAKYLTLSLALKDYYFTSDRVLYRDGYHVGRLDEIDTYSFTVDTEEIYGPITLELGFFYDERRTTSPWEGVAADKDYIDRSFWLGMSYPF